MLNEIKEVIRVFLFWRVYLCAGVGCGLGLYLHERGTAAVWLSIMIGLFGILAGVVWHAKSDKGDDGWKTDFL